MKRIIQALLKLFLISVLYRFAKSTISLLRVAFKKGYNDGNPNYKEIYSMSKEELLSLEDCIFKHRNDG